MSASCQSLAARVLFGIVITWLVAAALTVDIEYYDGYSAIANARYFLGFSELYVFDRGPLMGLLLMPAEAVRAMAGWPALDVRPHHLMMVLIHSAYLIAVYALLVRSFGRSWAVLASFAACMPSFLFFSYGPFLSHDLFPGLLLLAMLFLRERFVRSPSVFLWMELVMIGTAAALVKQTFGVFWILLLVVSAFNTLISKDGERGKSFLALGCGAVASGIITWLVLGWILGNTDPNVSLLRRPYRNLQYLAGVYEGKNVEFPIWIYFRNLPAYGWLMSLLILPGWVLSIRGTRFQQSLAVAWIGGFIFLHLLPLREVRYMAFLAPLSAGLLVPVLERLSSRRWLLAAAGLVLLIDLGRGFVEAARIVDPFYHSGIQARFFQELNDPAVRRGPVFVNSFMVNFVAPQPSPLAADRYHRIFHFGVVHLQRVLDCRDIRVITDARSAQEAALRAPEGAPLFFTSDILARSASWRTGPPQGYENFFQCAAVLQSYTVKIIEADDARPSEPDVVFLRKPAAPDDGQYIVKGPACASTDLGELFPVLQFESTNRVYSLERVGPNAYTIRGLEADAEVNPGGLGRLCRFEIQQVSTLPFDR